MRLKGNENKEQVDLSTKLQTPIISKLLIANLTGLKDNMKHKTYNMFFRLPL